MTKGLRLMMLFPLLTAVPAMGIQYVVPVLQKTLINDYILNKNVTSQPSWALHLWLIVGAIVSFDILNKVLGMVQSRIAAVSGNRFTRFLRTLLFEKIQMLSMSSVQKKSTGDLMGRINNDVAVVQNFMTNLLPTYFRAAHLLCTGACVGSGHGRVARHAHEPVHFCSHTVRCTVHLLLPAYDEASEHQGMAEGAPHQPDVAGYPERHPCGQVLRTRGGSY